MESKPYENMVHSGVAGWRLSVLAGAIPGEEAGLMKYHDKLQVTSYKLQMTNYQEDL
jgi:hypothetical protein